VHDEYRKRAMPALLPYGLLLVPKLRLGTQLIARRFFANEILI